MEVDMFVTCHHESVTCEVIIATKQNIDYTIIPKKKKNRLIKIVKISNICSQKIFKNQALPCFNPLTLEMDI